jgi:hypothetical protein
VGLKAAGGGREYDATKRRIDYLEAHPGVVITRDDAVVAPLWRARDEGGQLASHHDLGGLMDQLERDGGCGQR